MRYLLNERFRLRGWRSQPAGLFDTSTKRAFFFPKDQYYLLMRCDGVHDLDETALSAEDAKLLDILLKDKIIREAGLLEYLTPEQQYKNYPAAYRQDAHWSVTGACNLKCRHCFMSAPHARHGVPTHEQLLHIADQLAECGIFSVGLTGGEPLIREDFLELIDALTEREIGISTIYTNGWLVDEKFLDALDAHKIHPAFQISFDGIGCHDFLRGIPGAEERTLQAFKLLRERNYAVSAAFCLHRKNRESLRESVRLLASLGVRSIKCGGMMELGEWASPEMQSLRLTRQEELEFFEQYIPQYFEDDAPMSIMMSDTLMYSPGDPEWRIYNVKEVPKEAEDVPSCGMITQHFYIGAEGMVAPCMGMCDCGYASNFQNLFETPLKDILNSEEFSRLCYLTVGEVRNHNPKCRECKFVDRCTGGCRNAVLLAGEDYCGIDQKLCHFFENGWDERLRQAAQPAFEAYLKRCPPREQPKRGRFEPEPESDCP